MRKLSTKTSKRFSKGFRSLEVSEAPGASQESHGVLSDAFQEVFNQQFSNVFDVMAVLLLYSRTDQEGQPASSV